jgi:hypothetical protein
MTPRSYSLTILMALVRMNKITATTAISTMAANPIPTDCNKAKPEFMTDTPFASILGFEDGVAAASIGGQHCHHCSVARNHRHFASDLYNRLVLS